MISDPIFYLAAIPAVILVGLSKGGFSGIALMAVPLMSLVISPVKAAAIMLPILLVMDGVALWSYRGVYDRSSLLSLLPAAMVGIFIGWLTAAWVTADFIRLLLGSIAILFALDHWIKLRPKKSGRPGLAKGLLSGATAGFTSFIAHAGSPPFQMYMLPIRLEPRIFVGTGVIFFAIVNAVKVIPYFALGQFSDENIATALVLLPLAPLSTLAGVWIVKRIPIDVFYGITYTTVFLVGLKLIWDGLASYL
ncbi:MAG: sulfite exporter TauE/SafE family protein [Stappiaceae bacterium]